MSFFIKYINIIICTQYIYAKLLNQKINKRNCILFFLDIISSAIITYIDLQLPLISTIVLIIILSFQATILYRHNITMSFVFNIISYTITYIYYTLSTIIICGIWFLLKLDYSTNLVQILVLIMQCVFIQSFSHFKRIRNGMLFLQNNVYYYPISIIGLCILITSCFFNTGSNNQLFLIYFCTILLCALLLIFYFRTSITKTYLDQLTKRNNLDLNNQLEQITRKYDELYADKERLSAIVHSDKKLVNALKNAVMNYLENGNNDNERGKELLEEIERYSKEREGNIRETEKFLNPLPSCNIVVIDNLLAYMYQKAQQNNIELSLMINCDVVAASKDLINLEDFSTLLADLIDNAIIATIHNKGKLILVSFSIVKKHFTIQISDSGIPFTTEVLYTMGKERITTHADDNGNGIGLMQTFETLHKTNASLFIEEYNNPQAIYTKSLSVVFNKKNQTVLYTTRDQLEIAQLYQKSNLIIMKK